MPAIYVTEQDMFKYITFQTPLPKCKSGPTWYTDPVTYNWEDWTHVTSQWLANVLQDTDPSQFIYPFVWFLPPFIDYSFGGFNWTMVDDIGMTKNNTLWEEDPMEWDIEIPEQGLLVRQDMDSLEGEVYWIDEWIYEPFNTSLSQRLYVDGEEEWDWWNVFTKPINYTTLHLPDLERWWMEYDTDDVETVKHDWYGDFLYYWHGEYDVDGFEYLLTTSWIAPNCEDEERHEQSKSYWDVHDIIGSGLEPYEPPSDWNPWDDDGVITTGELMEIINHWVNDIPKNGHLVTTGELMAMISMWLSS
jgi:hypothetical protein